MMRHYGVFQWKDDVTEEKIAELWELFDTMKDHIPNILSIEHGKYDSDEGFNDGFTGITNGYLRVFDNSQTVFVELAFIIAFSYWLYLTYRTETPVNL